MHYIVDAKYIEGHKIWLSFNDHKEGIVNLDEILKNDHRPIFRELADVEKFKKFQLEADTIVWENGLDLAPEYLYRKLCETKDNNKLFGKRNS